MAPLLEVKNLVTRFYTEQGVVNAVNGISYRLAEGESLGIVGESGSGKTVGVMSLIGLIPSPPGRVENGEVNFHGRDLLKLRPAEIRHVRGREITMIFQDPMTSLNPVLTIGRQMTEGLKLHLGMNDTQARKRAIEMLDLVGLPGAEDRLNDYPHQFSGGQRQRIMIAMALSTNPSLLIADEPTTALDVTIQAQIVELIKELQEKLGMAIIWITHDLGVVARMVERLAVMYSGYIVEIGSVWDIYDKPAHPYTLGLLQSLPKVDARQQQRLASIEGLPPDLRQEFNHCPFAPRCPYVIDKCWGKPPLMPTDATSTGLLLRLSSKNPRVWSRSQMTQENGSKQKSPGQRQEPEKHFPIYRGVFRRQVGAVRAVDGVTFDIYKGETLGLVGESGSGKSTTGRTILQLLEPTDGEVIFQNRDLTNLSRNELRRTRRDMQMIFQDPYASLNPRLTVGGIVAEPLEVHNIGTPRERRERVQELLQLVGLNAYFVKRYPHEFSGGQRQRIGVAAPGDEPQLYCRRRPSRR